jgi:hypothetical protein
MMEPTEAYKYDNTFRQIVDLIRCLNHGMGFTLLRQCSVVMEDWKSGESKYPAMYEAQTGRIQCSKPNFTVQDKQAGLEKNFSTKPCNKS